MTANDQSERQIINAYNRELYTVGLRRQKKLIRLLWRIDNSKRMAVNRRLRELDAIESEFRAL